MIRPKCTKFRFVTISMQSIEEIQALEAEYGIQMKNANLTFARNQLLELRARKKAAQADLDDPDQDLSEKERREREFIIKSAETREKRIMGDANQFLKGGLNVQFQRALDRDAEEDLKVEKKINQDPQLTKLRRQLAEQQKLYNNAEEGVFKEQTSERIEKLETQINEREAVIDPRIVTGVRKDKINQKIAKILENPDTYFQPVESIAKLLEEWGLLKVANMDRIGNNVAPLHQIKIISFKSLFILIIMSLNFNVKSIIKFFFKNFIKI